jgi:hypothetical protein
MEIKEVIHTIYIANDGTRFVSEEACKDYEKRKLAEESISKLPRSGDWFYCNTPEDYLYLLQFLRLHRNVTPYITYLKADLPDWFKLKIYDDGDTGYCVLISSNSERVLLNSNVQEAEDALNAFLNSVPLRLEKFGTK